MKEVRQDHERLIFLVKHGLSIGATD